MKHFRFKLVGFGLAVLAGSVIASDDSQPPVIRLDVAEPTKGAGATMELVILPPEVRFNPSANAQNLMDPLWFSSAKPAGTSLSQSTTGIVPASARGLEGTFGKIITAGSDASSALAECSCETTKLGVHNSLPLPARVLMPWLRSVNLFESWPPKGPLIGIVPPDPEKVTVELRPTREVTSNLKWTKESNSSVATASGEWRQGDNVVANL